jgi:hypothetical protein
MSWFKETGSHNLIETIYSISFNKPSGHTKSSFSFLVFEYSGKVNFESNLLLSEYFVGGSLLDLYWNFAETFRLQVCLNLI